MGFDGKTLIHPAQIDVCNEVFAPSAAEIAWSRKVIAAFELPENAGKGALPVKFPSPRRANLLVDGYKSRTPGA